MTHVNRHTANTKSYTVAIASSATTYSKYPGLDTNAPAGWSVRARPPSAAGCTPSSAPAPRRRRRRSRARAAAAA
ncbi:unnamed protein product, partial [Iphiclides podalirius]